MATVFGTKSAGLLWWISDGINGVPYGDIYAARNGYQNRVAGAGDLILLMLNDASEAGGNHGTLCASAVAAQGVISNGAVLGMAPVLTIAVSNLYAGGSWLDSFRFISEGYDGNASTSHQGQTVHSRLATLLLMMTEQTIGHCIWIGLLEFTHQRRHISSLLAMVVTDMGQRPLPAVHTV